jgi:16S rRNA (uracil1498-N3)-methyltransferase
VSGFRPRFFAPQVDHRSFRGVSVDPEADLCGTELDLGAEDSRHALRVLRLGVGDECEIVTGAAVYAATVIAAAGPVGVRLITRLEGAAAGASYQIQVGVVQALARPAVMDYVLEKATEVGASFFILAQASGSPRRSGLSGGDRLARWRRITREAAKQSKQIAVPPVEVTSSVEQALRYLSATETLSLVLDPTASVGLQEVLGPHRSRPACVALWVGPESGWTAGESEQFSAAGLESARLGRSILRTETAGPVAVAVARLALGDW